MTAATATSLFCATGIATGAISRPRHRHRLRRALRTLGLMLTEALAVIGTVAGVAALGFTFAP
jgi:hypothetical protein